MHGRDVLPFLAIYPIILEPKWDGTTNNKVDLFRDLEKKIHETPSVKLYICIPLIFLINKISFPLNLSIIREIRLLLSKFFFIFFQIWIILFHVAIFASILYMIRLCIFDMLVI